MSRARNLFIERRYSEGRAERFTDFASEFVRLQLDVIVVDEHSSGQGSETSDRDDPNCDGVRR